MPCRSSVYLRLFCSIAIAYTSAIIYGINIRTSKVECYICRPKESTEFNVVIATLGGFIWSKLAESQLCIDWVGKWMRNNRCGAALLSTGVTSHRLDSAYFLTFFVTPSAQNGQPSTDSTIAWSESVWDYPRPPRLEGTAKHIQ